MIETRFRCVVCGKLTAGRMPRAGREDGDTTARYPRRHSVDGRPCPGNILEADWVDVDEDVEPRPSRLSDPRSGRALDSRRCTLGSEITHRTAATPGLTAVETKNLMISTTYD